jgi:hypothetical protein
MTIVEQSAIDSSVTTLKLHIVASEKAPVTPVQEDKLGQPRAALETRGNQCIQNQSCCPVSYTGANITRDQSDYKSKSKTRPSDEL